MFRTMSNDNNIPNNESNVADFLKSVIANFHQLPVPEDEKCKKINRNNNRLEQSAFYSYSVSPIKKKKTKKENFIFQDFYTLNTDAKSNHPAKYSCHGCDSNFAHKYMIIKHLKFTKAKHKCWICDQRFCYTVLLEIHLDTHKGHFKCINCKKEFSAQHVKIPKTCPFCNQRQIELTPITTNVKTESDESFTTEITIEDNPCGILNEIGKATIVIKSEENSSSMTVTSDSITDQTPAPDITIKQERIDIESDPLCSKSVNDYICDE